MARSLDQIQKQIEKLQTQATALRAKEVGGVVARIKEAIAYYELTPKDLFGERAGPKAAKASKTQARKPVPVKFRDSSGNTWTGRGNKPRWLTAELGAGKSLEDFRVKS